MGGELDMTGDTLAFLTQLRQFAPSEEVYGRLRVDLQDLLEASKWLVEAVKAIEGRELSRSELEDLLVEIDVNFVEHASYHLASLRGDLKATLENFPNDDDAS